MNEHTIVYVTLTRRYYDIWFHLFLLYEIPDQGNLVSYWVKPRLDTTSSPGLVVPGKVFYWPLPYRDSNLLLRAASLSRPAPAQRGVITSMSSARTSRSSLSFSLGVSAYFAFGSLFFDKAMFVYFLILIL